MNRFRGSLHPVFFDSNPETPRELDAMHNAMNQFRKDLDELQSDVVYHKDHGESLNRPQSDIEDNNRGKDSYESYLSYLNTLDAEDRQKGMQYYKFSEKGIGERVISEFEALVREPEEIERTIRLIKREFYGEKGTITFEGREYSVENDLKDLIDRIKELGNGKVIPENIVIDNYTAKPDDINGRRGDTHRGARLTTLNLSYRTDAAADKRNDPYDEYIASLGTPYERGQEELNRGGLEQEHCMKFLRLLHYFDESHTEQSVISRVKDCFRDQKGTITFEGKEYKVEENFEELIDRVKEIGPDNIVIDNYNINFGQGLSKGQRYPRFTTLNLSYMPQQIGVQAVVQKREGIDAQGEDDPYEAYLASLDDNKRQDAENDYKIREEQRCESFVLNFMYVSSSDEEVSEYAKESTKALFLGKKGIIRFEGKEYKVEENFDEFVARLKELGNGIINYKNIVVDNYTTKPYVVDVDGGYPRAPGLTTLDISYKAEGQQHGTQQQVPQSDVQIGEQTSTTISTQTNIQINIPSDDQAEESSDIIPIAPEETDQQNVTRVQRYVEDREKEKSRTSQDELLENMEGYTEFSNIPNEVYSEISGQYTEAEQLKWDRNRCQIRMTSKDENGVMYSNVRTKKMLEGYGHLLTELNENGYFEGNFKGKKMHTEAEIKEKYLKECKKQYKDKIWFAGDKQFNQIKDTIFGADSEKYPADKIYKELTGAATIREVERTFTEGYDTDILDDGIYTKMDNNSSVENMGDKGNRNFLKNDLTEYLRNIKKTPGILNVIKWLPIFNVKVDRPSEQDKKAIDDFLKTSEKITVTNGKDKAVALLEVFNDDEINTNTTEGTYAKVLVKHGITVDKKHLKDVVKAGNFYLLTQREQNSSENQHAIYLSVLKIIENEGGVQQAVNRFKPIVEQAKQDEKTEKKEGYREGKLLDADFKQFASKLSITDFSSATRLYKLDQSFFSSGIPAEKILANLNNDRMIDSRDIGGEKSGQQFLEVFNQVGKEIAMKNLLERAKLENKMLDLGLSDEMFDEGEIQKGNKKLILLLQNIISKPGADLITLLSNNVSEDPFEGLDFAAAKEYADKTAAEMVSKMDLKGLETIGLETLTPESMHSGLSQALYTEYTRGIGIGGKISFDEWIKGVSLNTGVQLRDDGTVVVGIGIDYKTSIKLGKGWSMNPELSAGAFIPLGHGKPDLASVAGGGLNIETAKERVTKNGVQRHLGLNTGVRACPAGVVVVSAGLNRSQDRVGGIDIEEQNVKNRFESKIISPILDNLSSSGITKLDFSDANVNTAVKNIIKKYASDNGVREKEIDTVVDATLRLLINYNNADISQQEIRDIISREVSSRYALAWANGKKEEVVKNGRYLSGFGLGAFWIVGAPYVGIYANINTKKHDLDGYGDRRSQEYGLDHQYENGWNEALIKAFNQEAGFKESEGLRMENDFVVIPRALSSRVKVNDKLRGNMKVDREGNVLLHKQTPMAAKKQQGVGTQSKEIIIGGKIGESFQKLDKVGRDWFTDGDINPTNILELGDGIRTYTPDVINKAIEDLKARFSEGNGIKEFVVDEERMRVICEKCNEINTQEPPHKVRLVIDADENGNLTINDPVEGDEGRGLEMEYHQNFEMIDSKAKKIARKVYDEALKLKDPRYLYDVKHDKPWPEYAPFDEAMQSANYVEAREKIKPIFTKLDKLYKTSSFTSISDELDEIQDPISLGQALMSIRNIFARAMSVHGAGDKYTFDGTMGEIIGRRADKKQIRGTIERSPDIPADEKDAYLALIDASEKYRKDHPELFNVKEAKAAQLNNTIGFNLGDKTNPENPLFNPETYNPTVKVETLEGLAGFTTEKRELLHKRAMENFASNPVLITPILKSLGLEGGTWTRNYNDGKITLDISKENVTKQVVLSSDLEFGYFTQCVNHMIILSNISAESSDGERIQFNSGVWERGSYREGNKTVFTSTTEFGIGISAITGRGDSGIKTEGGTNSTELPTTNPNGTTEVPGGSTAGDGNTNTSHGGRPGGKK